MSVKYALPQYESVPPPVPETGVPNESAFTLPESALPPSGAVDVSSSHSVVIGLTVVTLVLTSAGSSETMPFASAAPTLASHCWKSMPFGNVPSATNGPIAPDGGPSVQLAAAWNSAGPFLNHVACECVAKSVPPSSSQSCMAWMLEGGLV